MESDFWQPFVVRDLGFVTADRSARRFIHYLEVLRHRDTAAWDRRGVWARAKIDVRRDLAYAVGRVRTADGRIKGSMTFGGSDGNEGALEATFADRLRALETSIEAFRWLLMDDPEADESVYQSFLTLNPLLLDIYGTVIAKPNFVFPEGESPLGKKFVQPDFLIRRPGDKYRIVEIE